MQNADRFDIHNGTRVTGVDGDEIGTIAYHDDQMIAVREGAFFPKDHYMPIRLIARADADCVQLAVPGKAAMTGMWDESQVEAGGGGELKLDPAPFVHRQDTQRTHINAEDEIEIPLSQEEMSADTHEVERGEVRLRKNVVEDKQQLD